MRVPPSRLVPLAAAALLALVAGAAPLEEKFEKSYDLAGITKVRLENVNGPVRVETGDRPVLHLVAVKKSHGGHAEETLKDTEIHVSKTGSMIEIETRLPRRGRFFGLFLQGPRDAEVSYELTLPAGISTEVETVNGRVSAIKRSGTTTLSTVNGSIRAEGQEGSLKVNTVNGSVEIVFAGPSRATDVETVNGSVEITAAKDSSFRYQLQTVNGAIRSDFDVSVEKRFGNAKEARGEVNGGRERLAIETVNGEIRLRSAEVVAQK